MKMIVNSSWSRSRSSRWMSLSLLVIWLVTTATTSVSASNFRHVAQQHQQDKRQSERALSDDNSASSWYCEFSDCGLNEECVVNPALLMMMAEQEEEEAEDDAGGEEGDALLDGLEDIFDALLSGGGNEDVAVPYACVCAPGYERHPLEAHCVPIPGVVMSQVSPKPQSGVVSCFDNPCGKFSICNEYNSKIRCECDDGSVVPIAEDCPQASVLCEFNQIPDIRSGFGCSCPEEHEQDSWGRCYPFSSACLSGDPCSGYDSTCEDAVDHTTGEVLLSGEIVCRCEDETTVAPGEHCGDASAATSCYPESPCGRFATCYEHENKIKCECFDGLEVPLLEDCPAESQCPPGKIPADEDSDWCMCPEGMEEDWSSGTCHPTRSGCVNGPCFGVGSFCEDSEDPLAVPGDFVCRCPNGLEIPTGEDCFGNGAHPDTSRVFCEDFPCGDFAECIEGEFGSLPLCVCGDGSTVDLNVPCPVETLKCPPGQKFFWDEQKCHPVDSPCFDNPCRGFDARCQSLEDGNFLCLCPDGTTVKPSGHCDASGTTSCYPENPCGMFATCEEGFEPGEVAICVCHDGTQVEFLEDCSLDSVRCPPTKVPDPFWQECMCPPGEAEDYYSSRCHPTGSPCVEREQCFGFNATCDTTVQDDGALSFVCLCQDGTEVPPSGHCSTSGVTSCFEADDPCGPFATCVEDFVGDEFTIACQCDDGATVGFLEACPIESVVCPGDLVPDDFFNECSCPDGTESLWGSDFCYLIGSPCLSDPCVGFGSTCQDTASSSISEGEAVDETTDFVCLCSDGTEVDMFEDCGAENSDLTGCYPHDPCGQLATCIDVGEGEEVICECADGTTVDKFEHCSTDTIKCENDDKVFDVDVQDCVCQYGTEEDYSSGRCYPYNSPCIFQPCGSDASCKHVPADTGSFLGPTFTCHCSNDLVVGPGESC